MIKTFFLGAAVLWLGACASLPSSSEWIARGDGYFKDGQVQKALAAYDRAEKLNDKNAAVYASRGAARFFSGDYAGAQADFLKVLDMNPYQADAYSALGSVLAAQGQYDAALEVLNMALKLAPSKPEVFFSRGGVRFMLGQYEGAAADYTSVLTLRPAADVYNARGAAYLKLGKKAEADKDFETAKSGTVPEKLNDYSMID